MVLRPVRTTSQFKSAEVPHPVVAKHKSVMSLLVPRDSLGKNTVFWGFWEHD